MTVTDEMVERGLEAKNRIDPFGRHDLNMTPQEFRRHIVRKIIEAALTEAGSR